MKTIAFFLITLCSITAFSQVLIETEAKIIQVTVFANRAQVESIAEVSVPAGNSKIVITDLASTIDVNSIKVGGKGSFILKAINFEKDFISKKQIAFQDSIDALDRKIERLNMQAKVCLQEEKMIMDNTKIKSNNDDLYADDLEVLIVFFRNKLTDLGERKLAIERELKTLLSQKQRLEKQMQMDPSKRLPLGKIILTINANIASDISLDLNYIVHSAGWSPSYDVRVENLLSPVQVIYKADIRQNTGVDWKNVKLVLSTASVDKRTIKPELNPNYLFFFENMVPAPQRMASKQAPQAMMEIMDVEDMASSSDFTQVLETELDVQFIVALPYTIQTGSLETVEVRNLSLNANYVTFVVPKYDPNGFLVAEISDWERYSLIPGNANVYLSDTFIGKSYIRNPGVNEKLKISLGREEGIQVEKVENLKLKTRKNVGSNIRETFAYTIKLRNTKNELINILLEDQIPVSQDSDIEIEIENISGGLRDTKTGKVNWNLSIPPAQSRQVELIYTVKYPKDKRVVNL